MLLLHTQPDQNLELDTSDIIQDLSHLKSSSISQLIKSDNKDLKSYLNTLMEQLMRLICYYYY